MDQEHNNNEFPQGEHEFQAGEEQLESNRPAVAAAPGKLLIFVVFAVVFIGIVVKSLFFGAPPPPPKEQKQAVAQAVPQNTQVNMTRTDLPTPPTFSPPPAMPPVVEAPPVPQMAPPPEPQITAKSGPTSEQLKNRIKSPMVSGGAGVSASNANADAQKKKAAATDPNSAFAQSIADSTVETVEATRIKNMNITLAQGKFIQGVLETAINSTLPGQVRAIVSHDTYAESGRTILIPKGSRIIGSYSSSIKHGQARVFIIWSRVIRPDGIDVTINSPGVDALGRAGMSGIVDNHYLDSFATALLTSALDVSVAAVGDALFGDQQQTTSTGPNGGGTTTTSSPTSTAMETAVQNVGSVGNSIVASTVNLEPVINVDQGEMINIFVNKDVVFPAGLSSESGFIP